MKRAGANAGFTLMEVLVVLVITGLVSTVLMQALAQSYGLQERFSTQLQRSEVGAMQDDWYRQIVQGLLPDLPDAPGRLRGDDRGFKAVVLDPFSRIQGVPQPAELTLKFDAATGLTRLQWLIDGREATLASWPGLSQSAFIYVDDKSEPHDRWPPPLGIWPSLPAAIQLRLRGADRDDLLVAVPRVTFRPLKSVEAMGLTP